MNPIPRALENVIVDWILLLVVFEIYTCFLHTYALHTYMHTFFTYIGKYIHAYMRRMTCSLVFFNS